MNIKLTTDKNGNEVWRLDARDYKKGRLFFKAKSDAVAEMQRLEKLGKDGASAINFIPARDGIELTEILTECSRLKVTLRGVLEFYQKHHVAQGSHKPKLVAEVYRELLIDRRTHGCRASYLHSLAHGPLKQFGEMFGPRVITTMSREDIKSFFTAKNYPSAGGVMTARARISGLFGYALREKYILENPCSNLGRVVDNKKTMAFVLTNEQICALLNYTRQQEPTMLAYLVLGVFCGLRPDEARQMRWEFIDFQDNTVFIGPEVTKTNCQRVLNPLPAGIAWLKEAKRLGAVLPIGHMTRRRYLQGRFGKSGEKMTTKGLRGVLGLAKWPKDCLRHTAATNWMGVDKNLGNVAYQLGNSPAVLKKHYLAMVKDARAKSFWEILPDGEAKTIAFPTAAAS